MSITFALIPTSKKYEAFASEVERKIKRVVHCEIIFDNDYENIMTNKLAYYKSQEIDVITIGLNNKISVRFIESFRRPQTMELNELIECLKSYVDALNTENDYYHENNEDIENNSDDDDDNKYEKKVNNIKKQSKRQTNQSRQNIEQEQEQEGGQQTNKNEEEEDDDTISCIIL